ncbi:MAG: HAD family hydrolase, partial [Flavobacteriaceae bacterium]
FQLLFALDRVQEMASEHPEWEGKEPFKYVLGNNKDSLMAMGIEGLMDIVLATHSGNTPAEFQQFVNDWMDNSRHPITGKRYTEMVFKPMLELMDYLEEYQFKVYIVSGGGVDFMRAWAPKVYGLPKEQIIGSSLRTEFVSTDGGVRLEKMAEIDFVDDKAGKVINIQKIIGAKPIFCAGNSDGDLEMMQWTATNIHKSFKLFIHHTDGQREFSYDRNSSFGKFDGALDLAREKGWKLVDMKNDWLEIYP